MLHKIVRHIRQEVTEYYEYNQVLLEYISVSIYRSNDWAAGTWEYIELRHSMEPDKAGLYGYLIKGR